jgi:hypothetical protein
LKPNQHLIQKGSPTVNHPERKALMTMRKGNQRNENKDNETEPMPLLLLDASGSSTSQQPARPRLGGSLRFTWIAVISIGVAFVGAGAAVRQLGGTISQKTLGGLDRLLNRLIEKRAVPPEGGDDQQMIWEDSQYENMFWDVCDNVAEPEPLDSLLREVCDNVAEPEPLQTIRREGSGNDAEPEPLESLFREVFDLVDEGIDGISDREISPQLHRAFKAVGLAGLNDIGDLDDRKLVDLHVSEIDDLIDQADTMLDRIKTARQKLAKAQGEVRADQRTAKSALWWAQGKLAFAEERLAHANAEKAKSEQIKSGVDDYVAEMVDRGRKVAAGIVAEAKEDADQRAAKIVAEAEEKASKIIDQVSQEAAKAAEAEFCRWLTYVPVVQGHIAHDPVERDPVGFVWAAGMAPAASWYTICRAEPQFSSDRCRDKWSHFEECVALFGVIDQTSSAGTVRAWSRGDRDQNTGIGRLFFGRKDAPPEVGADSASGLWPTRR